MQHPIRHLTKDEYPARLREIPDPPPALTERGTMPPENHAWLCVVGARKYSEYGKNVTTDLIRGLRGYPVVIVSGLALGIDGIAHRAALDAGLTTVAVPGSGLADRVLYPASHFALAHEILSKGGALLSEFEPDWRPRPESFPQRNRIMAGLSHAVLVIEAEERSGTLITARLATEYNRDVLTVPHSIYNATGAGPHLLMTLGATPIRSAGDILLALHLEESHMHIPLPLSHTTTIGAATTIESKILSLLREPMSKDQLLALLDIPTTAANIAITKLELSGLVKSERGTIRLL